MSFRIGILGATGQVGRVAAEYLESDFQIYKAARSPRNENNYFSIDVQNDDELIGFIQNCDLIINAIGPSYEKSERIIHIINRCNISCVDLFGTNMLERDSSLNDAVVNLVGAGCEPGLTGAILNKLAREYQDGDKLIMIKGGEEVGGKAALKDIILSSLSGYVMPNKALKDGDLKNEKVYGEFKEEVDGFEASVYKEIMLDKEAISVCRKYGIKDFIQYRGYTDLATKGLISEACVRYAVSKDDASKEAICDEIFNQQVLNMEGKSEWVAIYAVLKKANSYYSIILTGKDSSYLSGVTAAIIAEKFFESNTTELKGTMWAWDFIDPDYLFECLKKAGVQIIEEIENTDNQVEYGEI